MMFLYIFGYPDLCYSLWFDCPKNCFGIMAWSFNFWCLKKSWLFWYFRQDCKVTVASCSVWLFKLRVIFLMVHFSRSSKLLSGACRSSLHVFEPRDLTCFVIIGCFEGSLICVSCQRAFFLLRGNVIWGSILCYFGEGTICTIQKWIQT